MRVEAHKYGINTFEGCFVQQADTADFHGARASFKGILFSQERLMRLSDVLLNIGRPVAFYPGMAKLLGGIKRAVFVCQMAYWNGKGSDPDGWIYKTAEEIEEETSLTYKEQTGVRASLVEAGILQERYARTEHKMYFRIDWVIVNKMWDGHLTDGHMPESKIPPSQKSDGTLPKVSSLNSNTENTTENTRERNPAPDFKSMTQKDAYQVPTLKLFKEATDFFPGSPVWQYVHETIEKHSLNYQQIHDANEAWVAAAFKQNNVKGILEWAANGVPEKYQLRAGPSSEQKGYDPFSAFTNFVEQQEAK
jgi:hypothetical protein